MEATPGTAKCVRAPSICATHPGSSSIHSFIHASITAVAATAAMIIIAFMITRSFIKVREPNGVQTCAPFFGDPFGLPSKF